MKGTDVLDTVSHAKHNSSECTNMTGKGKNSPNFNDLHGKALLLKDIINISGKKFKPV